MPVTESSVEITTAVTSENVTPLTSVVPKSVITIVGLGVCILIGIAIAKLADWIHDRLSLRDNASDISEHTRHILKARFALFAFKKTPTDQDSQQRRLSNTRSFGLRWMAKASARRKSVKQVAEAVNKEDNSTKVTLVSYTAKENTLMEDRDEWENLEVDIQDQSVQETSEFVTVHMENTNHENLNKEIVSEVKNEKLNGFAREVRLQTVLEDVNDSFSPNTKTKTNILTPLTLPESVTVEDSLLKEFSSESDLHDGSDEFLLGKHSPDMTVFSIAMETKRDSFEDIQVETFKTDGPTAGQVATSKKAAWGEETNNNIPTDPAETNATTEEHVSKTPQLKSPSRSAVVRPMTSWSSTKPVNGIEQDHNKVINNNRPVTAATITPNTKTETKQAKPADKQTVTAQRPGTAKRTPGARPLTASASRPITPGGRKAVPNARRKR